MRVLGLTGPTGAGKGVVTARMREAGVLVVDTDRIAREVVEKGQPCLTALADAFGDGILQADGSLDRAALAAAAFRDEAATKRLNAITHPFIIERSVALMKQSDCARAVIDAPLLFESGMDRLCDVTAAVLAPASMRLERIMRRDGIDRERAQMRMNAQPDDAFYRQRADHILVNDRDPQALTAAVDALIREVWEESDG